MQTNKNLPLILKDVYVYDIESCHYTILNKLGYDLSNIDKDNKKERNIQIGIMMRKNPRMTSLLRTTTNSIIDDYILENSIKEEDIIIRQYDGLILTKKLHTTKLGHIPLDLRKTFQVLINSINRSSFIALDENNNVVIKGVPFRYQQMDTLYKRLCETVLIGRKESIFRNLQKIKNEILTKTDPTFFGIPSSEGKFNVFLKGYDELEVSESILKIMDSDDIDKRRYFKFYIQPFTKSIVFQFVK